MDESVDVSELSPLEIEFYDSIMLNVNQKKYVDISADRMQIVFGRIYSTLVINQLSEEGKILLLNQNG